MNEKVNIAELLKDCPNGMELDCTMYDNVTLFRVSTESDYPIKIVTKNGFSTRLTKYGQNVAIEDAKCVIFPKGKTTWEGFVPPCNFKDGDVIYVRTILFEWVSIFKKEIENKIVTYAYYVLNSNRSYPENNYLGVLCKNEEIVEKRLATEEEKKRLFKAIKEIGYTWNPETKTLERLIVHKFKVGDEIMLKNSPNNIISIVTKVNKDGSIIINDYSWTIKYEQLNNYELVQKKFDITTLKPFDKVLVRDGDNASWTAANFSHYEKDIKYDYPYFASASCFKQCVPYEGNERLLGKTDDCDEYYKTW